MNNFLKTIIISAGLLVSSLSYADWGAEEVASSNRTNQSWESSFPTAPTVTVGPTGDVATISEGISICNNLAASVYCHVKVQAGTYRVGGPTEIYISRSRLKLSGSTTGVTKIESTDPFGVYIGNNGNSSLQRVIVENLFISGQFSPEPVYTSKQGIYIYGKQMTDISIRDNTIDGLHADLSVNGSGNFIAGTNAIAVDGIGANESEAIQNLLIKDNTVTNMENGYSENITLNGNIKRWEILDNYIDGVTNIGIDAIGGENVSPTNSVNAARYGFIEGNTVKNLVEVPANTEGVAAIYVDGGRNIHIENNTVDVTSHGYTIGAENCIGSSDITMINNTSKGAMFEDLTLGGYSPQGYTYGVDSECDGTGGGHGSVKNITVYNNTFNSPNASPLNSNDSNFPVQMNYRVSSAIVNQNGIIEVNENGDGSAPFGENAVKKTINSNNVSIISVSAASNTANENKIIDGDNSTQWNNTTAGSGTSFDLYLDGTYTISSIEFLSQWDSKIIVEVNGQEAFAGWTENTGGVNYTINFTTPLTGNVITIKSQTGQNWLAVKEISNIVGTSVNTPSISSVSAASNTANENKIIDGDNSTQWNNTTAGSGTSFDLYLDGTYTISSIEFLSQWDSKIIVEVNGQEAFAGWTENTGGVNYTINFTTPLTGNVITIKSQTGQNWLAVKEVKL